MSKKSDILELFHSKEWFYCPGGMRAKMLIDSDFESIGLYASIDNRSQYCDVLYAKRIIQALGHRVIIGSAFNVYESSKHST